MQRKTKLHRSRSRPNPFRNNRTNKDPTLQKFARTTRPNRYNSRPHLQTTTRHPTTLRTRKTKRTRIWTVIKRSIIIIRRRKRPIITAWRNGNRRGTTIRKRLRWHIRGQTAQKTLQKFLKGRRWSNTHRRP